MSENNAMNKKNRKMFVFFLHIQCINFKSNQYILRILLQQQQILKTVAHSQLIKYLKPVALNKKANFLQFYGSMKNKGGSYLL